MNARRFRAVSTWSNAALRMIASGKRRRAVVYGSNMSKFITKAEAQSVLKARARLRDRKAHDDYMVAVEAMTAVEAAQPVPTAQEA